MLGLQSDEDALLAVVREFDTRRLRRARALRRMFLVVLTGFVVAGALSLLGAARRPPRLRVADTSCA